MSKFEVRITLSYLEKDREDESEAELVAEGRHGPPQDGAEE